MKKVLSIFLTIQVIASIFSLPLAQATSCPSVSPAGVVSPQLQPNGNYLNCSFAGAKLNNAVFDSITISSADFTGADFSNSTIKNSSISNSDLTGANFTNAIFENNTLASLTLTNTNFQNATFSGITSNGLSGLPLSMSTMYKITSGVLLCPYAKLDGINLSGVDLRGVFMTGASLKNAILNNTLTAGLNLSYANLTNANMSGFIAGTNVGMEYATITGANLKFTDLRKARLNYIITGNLLNADQAYLPTGWNRSSGYLIGKYANLTGATFNNVNFSGWDLYGVDLTDSILTSVNLTNVDLRHSTLRRSSITNSTITGTNFYEANVYRLRTSGLIGTPSAVSYTTHCVIGGFYFGWGVNLTNSNFSNLNLYGCDLGGADISGSNVSGTRFFGVDTHWMKANSLVGTPFSTPAGITFKYQSFFGPGVDLSDADLQGKDLSNLDLTGSRLDNCNLSGANFSNSVLTDVWLNSSNVASLNFQNTLLNGLYSSNLSGIPLNLPTNYVAKYGYILGPEVSLVDRVINNLDFSNLNLSGSHLSGLDAINTNFTNTNLTNASFWYGTLTGANFTSATLSGVNVENVDFTDAIFENTVALDLVGVPMILPTNWFLVNGDLLTVPEKVALPSASNVDTTSITVSWSQPTIRDNTASFTYAVRYKSNDLGSSWVEITDLSVLSKRITSLSAGKKYEVQVRASNAASEGAWSQSIEVDTPNALTITNTTLTNPANVNVALASTGGLGNGEIAFTVEGSNCFLSGINLSATSPATCKVTAKKSAQGIYAELISSTKNFIFTAVAQPNLEITNQTTLFPVNSEIALQVNGGAGSGVLSFSVEGEHCQVEGGILSADAPTQCKIKAKKSASGIYLEAISQPKIFEFSDVAVPAEIVVTGLDNSETNSLIFNQYLEITVSSNATDYSVETDSNCTLSGGKLTANIGSGFCTITVTVPALQNVFTQTIFSKQIKLGLATIQVPVLTVPKIGKMTSLIQTYKVGSKSASLKWASNTLKICTITSGKLKALKKGTCKVSVSSTGIKDYISPLAVKTITLSIK